MWIIRAGMVPPRLADWSASARTDGRAKRHELFQAFTQESSAPIAALPVE